MWYLVLVPLEMFLKTYIWVFPWKFPVLFVLCYLSCPWQELCYRRSRLFMRLQRAPGSKAPGGWCSSTSTLSYLCGSSCDVHRPCWDTEHSFLSSLWSLWAAGCKTQHFWSKNNVKIRKASRKYFTLRTEHASRKVSVANFKEGGVNRKGAVPVLVYSGVGVEGYLRMN